MSTHVAVLLRSLGRVIPRLPARASHRAKVDASIPSRLYGRIADAPAGGSGARRGVTDGAKRMLVLGAVYMLADNSDSMLSVDEPDSDVARLRRLAAARRGARA
jgi:hypothetical protein